MGDKVYVTRPFLPPLEEVNQYLEKIWADRLLTNNGRFHNELENKLAEFLNVKYVSLLANGTLALLLALKALEITGEVITTPYSFVATTHILWWNQITPVFVDIQEKTCNIDPVKIERAITEKTKAILPVHVYGNPCEIESIKQIAEIHNLKIIYDACHAFGVKYKNESIFNFGDISVVSFHATKIFNTFEGGAIITNSKELKKKIDFLKNFGFSNETTVIGPGINAKMNEFQAAIGLLQLKYFNSIIEKRRKIYNYYIQELNEIKGIRTLTITKNTTYNYAYFPIFIDREAFGMTRDELYDLFKCYNIYTRRYFFPLISEFPVYNNLPSSDNSNLINAYKASREVLCLPIYPDLNLTVQQKIIDIIKTRK